MVTNIGNTSAKVVISDNATPSSGTYAWYLEPQIVRCSGKLPWEEKTRGNYATGISIGIKSYIIDNKWELIRFQISSKTDYDNLLKALNYWEKNNSLLYLSVQNEWSGNLAVWGTYAAPTTLSQVTGQLSDLYIQIGPNTVEGSIIFNQLTKTTGG